MTFGEVESRAIRTGPDVGDFNVKAELRFNVLQEFLDRVSDAAWLRRNSTLTTVAGTRDYTLPLDFHRMRWIAAPENYSGLVDELTYYGENAELDMRHEQVTEQNPPTAYKIINEGTTEGLRKLRLNCPADAVYNFEYSYVASPVVLSSEDDVNIDPWIPVRFQWALVEGLRRAWYEHRFGQDDVRFITADRKFENWIARASDWKNKEPARRGAHTKYAR